MSWIHFRLVCGTRLFSAKTVQFGVEYLSDIEIVLSHLILRPGNRCRSIVPRTGLEQIR
jgi:hypothetical protein